MAQEFQQLCDGCGEVVRGKVRGQFIDRNFVEVRGGVTLQMYDDRKRGYNYQHLTRPLSNTTKDGKEWVGENLVFCNKSGIPCFAKYVDRRYNEIQFHLQQKRQEALRAERNKELEEEERQRIIRGG